MTETFELEVHNRIFGLYPTLAAAKADAAVMRTPCIIRRILESVEVVEVLDPVPQAGE